MSAITQNLMTEDLINELLKEFQEFAPQNPSRGDFGSMYLQATEAGDEIVCWIEDWDNHDTIGVGQVNRKTKKYTEHYF